MTPPHRCHSIRRHRLPFKRLLPVTLFCLASIAASSPTIAQIGVPPVPKYLISVKAPELYEDGNDLSTFIFNDGTGGTPDQLSRWDDARSKTKIYSMTSGSLHGLSDDEQKRLAGTLATEGIEFELIYRGLGTAGICDDAAEDCCAAFGCGGGGTCTDGLWSDDCNGSGFLCRPYYDDVGEDSVRSLIARIDRFTRANQGTVDRVRTEGLFKPVFPQWWDDDWGCDFDVDKAIEEGVDYIQTLHQAYPEIKITDGINGLNWMSIDRSTNEIYPCTKGYASDPPPPGHESRCHGDGIDVIRFRDDFYDALEVAGIAVGPSGVLDTIHSDGEYRIVSENAIKPCSEPCAFDMQEYAVTTAAGHPDGVNGWYRKMANYIGLGNSWGLKFEKTFNTKDDNVYVCQGPIPAGETVEQCHIRVTYERVLDYVAEWGDRMGKLGLLPYPDVSQFNQFGTLTAPLPLFEEDAGYTFFHLVNEGGSLINP